MNKTKVVFLLNFSFFLTNHIQTSGHALKTVAFKMSPATTQVTRSFNTPTEAQRRAAIPVATKGPLLPQSGHTTNTSLPKTFNGYNPHISDIKTGNTTSLKSFYETSLASQKSSISSSKIPTANELINKISYTTPSLTSPSSRKLSVQEEIKKIESLSQINQTALVPYNQTFATGQRLKAGIPIVINHTISSQNLPHNNYLLHSKKSNDPLIKDTITNNLQIVPYKESINSNVQRNEIKKEEPAPTFGVGTHKIESEGLVVRTDAQPDRAGKINQASSLIDVWSSKSVYSRFKNGFKNYFINPVKNGARAIGKSIAKATRNIGNKITQKEKVVQTKNATSSRESTKDSTVEFNIPIPVTKDLPSGMETPSNRSSITHPKLVDV